MSPEAGRAAEKNNIIGSLGPRLGAEIGIGSRPPIHLASYPGTLQFELQNVSASIQSYGLTGTVSELYVLTHMEVIILMDVN